MTWWMDALVILKKKSISNGLREGDCANIVQAAAKMKDPLDGQEPWPIPVRRVLAMLRSRG